jgi:hypothetical protein
VPSAPNTAPPKPMPSAMMGRAVQPASVSEAPAQTADVPPAPAQ